MDSPIAIVRWEEKGVELNLFYESVTKQKTLYKDPIFLMNHFEIVNNIYPTR